MSGMMNRRKRIYAMKAELIQAVAHPIRLAILEYLSMGEQCVGDIVEHVDAQQSNVSRHLALMLKAGVLECRKEGLKVFYRIKTTCILDFIKCVERVLCERVAGDAAVLNALPGNFV